MKSFRQFLFCTFQFDPYVILGLQKTASIEQIRAAYLNLSKQYHPDVNSSEDAADRFKQIHSAYNYLKKNKFEEKVNEEFKSQFYAAQSEEELFKRIFGFYFYEQPYEYYKPENAQKRHDYQELLKKYKKSPEQESKQQDEVKVNRIYKENNNYSKTNLDTFIKMSMLGLICFGSLGLYLVFMRRPPDQEKQTLQQDKFDKIRTLTMQRHQQNLENVKNMYSDINHRMIRFNPNVRAIDLLLTYTIYEDLEFYYVKPELFYEPEKNVLLSDNFEKNPIIKSKINYRISQAMEAERCLQNIFVSVSDVLKQIEEKGYYTPPGVFMQFFGYIYFKIRNKPIIQEHLINAQKTISLFDLYFQYQSPIPYYYYEYDEVQIFTDEPTNDFSHSHLWEGNAFFNTKQIDKFYLKGPVKNIFFFRPKKNDKNETMYHFAWGDHYQHIK